MTDPFDEDIIRHAFALRGLASALVGASDAQDLVQDVAVVALQERPRDPSAARAWLQSVLRHTASRRHRDEQRRREREQVQRPDHVRVERAAVDVAAHREAVARLQSALLSLSLIYQDVIYARYFEGLTPSEIATRTNESLATVKSRLRRGLEHLRGSLQSSVGNEWRVGFVAAFGLGRGVAPTAAPVVGMLIMATVGKLVGAAIAVVLLCWWMWPEHSVPISTPTEKARSGAKTGVEAPPDQASIPAQRQAADLVSGAALADKPTLIASQGVTIIGRCIDLHGAPLPGVRATGKLFSLSGAGFVDELVATTAADGAIHLLLPIRPDHGHALELELAEHCNLEESWFNSKPGGRIELGDVYVPTACHVAGSVVDVRRIPQSDVLIDVLPSGNKPAKMSSFIGHRATSETDGRFATDGVVPPGDYVVQLRNRNDLSGQDKTFTIAPGQRQHFVELRVEAGLPKCHGVVVDEAGAPIASAGVTLDGARFSPFVKTDGNGRFVLDPDPHLQSEYRVDANARGYFSTKVGWDPDSATEPLRVVLRRKPGLRVRVVDSQSNQPITGFSVWLLRPDIQSNVPKVREAEHPGGLVEIPCGPGDYFLVVDPTDARYSKSAMIPTTVKRGADAEVTVALSAGQSRRLVLRAAGKPVVGATVDLVDCGGVDAGFETEVWSIGTCRVFGRQIGCLLESGTTDADGVMQLRGPVGPLTLRISGGGAARQLVQPVRLEERGDLVVEALAGGVLVGQLQPPEVVANLLARRHAEADRAFPRAGIRLRSVDGVYLRSSSEGGLPVAGDGSFRIEGIPPGAWDLVLVGSWRSALGTFTVAAGQVLHQSFDAQDLVQVKAQIRLRVDGLPHSKPIRYYGAHAVDIRGKRLRSTGTGTPDQTGRFSVKTYAGELFVEVDWHDAKRQPHTLTGALAIPADPQEELVLDIRTGQVDLRCLDHEGQPAGNAVLRVRLTPLQRPSQHETDAEGRLRLSMGEGSYEWSVLPRRLSKQQARQQLVLDHGYAALEQSWLPLTRITVAGNDATPRSIQLPPEWSR